MKNEITEQLRFLQRWNVSRFAPHLTLNSRITVFSKVDIRIQHRYILVKVAISSAGLKVMGARASDIVGTLSVTASALGRYSAERH